MTKQQMAVKEAEDFVRKAVSRISEKPVSEKAIRSAANKVAKAIRTSALEQHA